ncbi:rhomboid family intramembrane serine protease [Nocardia sp. NPDC127526]|uniref:rhomboid family intramembrane serine protease n=1 Tax=Nocardia sp. NPDC127526 TaxID=3345393 RepID=UPI003641F70F
MNPYQPAPTCFRHPDRTTGLGCTRCGRPACPDCLTPAAVGQHCTECVRQGRQDVRPVRNQAGAAVSSNSQPFVTWALIAINVIVFGITAFEARNAMENRYSNLFMEWVLAPALVGEGEWWRVIGSGFLHFGWIHLAVNMLALYMLGPYCEAALGRARYLAVYVVSLLGGSAAVTVLEDPLRGTAGASGAIFGLFGAVAIIMLRTKQNPTQILVLLVINLIITFTVPNISVWGHLGGLVAGTVAAAGILYLPRWLRVRTQGSAAGIGWAVLAAVAVVAIAAIVAGAPAVVSF